ncbi:MULTISPECIES: Clp protease ClpP [Chryseobacterium]|uniref:ATP-dependent Clp endopeptidase, proteolytic subunit ClpP n=1 Tax=Chryseobacterium gambrini TaxID=373672 RepID=A0A1N7LE14_9FLAO|nr:MULTISPECIES: Clp protease ClpP [Chryseobacterium]SIS72082.1 ATP-dependent Clp endopeptidase, proteolytic subunit ClpP [Chryseobacterium gambrini]
MKKLPIFNYHITNQGGDRLDVFIDGTIVDAETQEILKNWWGDESSVSFKSFRTEVLDSGLKNIRITINSFGGQIGDAMAMHDFIQQLENDGYDIETIGIGMVCSAATYILSASKNSKISKNAYYMIHNVSGGVWGDVNEIENYAKQMRNFNNNIRDFYANLTGKTSTQVEKWMNETTWFYGEDVQKNGFVKEVINTQNPTSAINKADWPFKNFEPMNVYNSLVNKPSTEEKPDENLIQNNLDMNLATLIGNAINSALANFNIIPKEGEGEQNKFTPETITNAVATALEGYEPPAPTNEQIQNAISNFFTNGLPENMITQIAEAVKPVDFKESEDWKKLGEWKTEIENKISNKQTPAPTPENNEAKKFEGVSFE